MIGFQVPEDFKSSTETDDAPTAPSGPEPPARSDS